MIRKISFLFFVFFILYEASDAQQMSPTEKLFQRNNENHIGRLSVTQNPGIDSLVTRYILSNMKMNGLEGFRIQIYSSSNRNAREESGKVRMEFVSKFSEGLTSYASFAEPGYYKIRVGDFRTKTEGTKYLLMVRKVFPDAYLVPDIINFPDLNKK